MVRGFFVRVRARSDIPEAILTYVRLHLAYRCPKGILPAGQDTSLPVEDFIIQLFLFGLALKRLELASAGGGTPE